MKNLLILAFLLNCLSVHASYQKIEGFDHYKKKLLFNTTKTRATVLVFVSSKCPCSNSHIEEIEKLKKLYPNFSFVGVHSNYSETREEAIEYFSKVNISFPIIYDYESTLAKKLGAIKTPHAYIFNDKGDIVYRGGVTNRSNAANATKFYLRLALLDIHSGRSPRTPERKTLGCYIALKD